MGKRALLSLRELFTFFKWSLYEMSRSIFAQFTKHVENSSCSALMHIQTLWRTINTGARGPALVNRHRERASWRITITILHWASLVAQLVTNPPAMRETWVRSLVWEDPLEKGMATHSSILAWEIPRTEEPGGLQSTGSQRFGHNWATKQKNSSSCVTEMKTILPLILKLHVNAAN